MSLTVVGLNFGLLIGAVAGLISFIPFVGSIVGFVLSVGVAIVQFWPDWIWVLVVAGIFAAGQFLEGNILQPRLVGSSIGVHPVWLMFALFAFGALFGFVGVLLAVPVTAALGVLVRFAIAQYRHSSSIGAGKAGRRKSACCEMAESPQQIPLTLSHAPHYGRDSFVAGPVEQRRARPDRALAGLAVAGRRALRSGRLGQDASCAYLARTGGCADSSRRSDITGQRAAFARGERRSRGPGAGGHPGDRRSST